MGVGGWCLAYRKTGETGETWRSSARKCFPVRPERKKTCGSFLWSYGCEPTPSLIIYGDSYIHRFYLDNRDRNRQK